MSGIFFNHGGRKSYAKPAGAEEALADDFDIQDLTPAPSLIAVPRPDLPDLSIPWPLEEPILFDPPHLRDFDHIIREFVERAREDRQRSEEESETNLFGYLFGSDTAQNGRHPKDAGTLDALKRLGRHMTEFADEEATNSNIPPIYTYWGQFIDHDITANTDRNARFSDITEADLTVHEPSDVLASLRNLRTPALDLDSVYLDGPSLDSSENTRAKLHYEGEKFLLGVTSPASLSGTERVPPEDDRRRDLPRIFQLLAGRKFFEVLEDLHPEFAAAFDQLLPQGRDEAIRRFASFAVIGDARNDENLNVAQFHLAVLRFHNAAIDWVEDNEGRSGRDLFERARQLTRWHYQWLTVNDYLDKVCQAGTVAKIFARGLLHYDLEPAAFMPLEFSVAAFRFGHSMIRGGYDFNRNFGENDQRRPMAHTLEDLFAYTGGGATGVDPFNNLAASLPFDRVIEWDRLTNLNASDPDRFARKIDPFLTQGLSDLNEGGGDDRVREIMSRLAIRNLLRGYHLSIPSGQAVAASMSRKDPDIEALTPDEILSRNSPELVDAIRQGNFQTQTPLWFYLLKEAQLKSNGDALGPIGSNIVAETIIGMLHKDTSSYLFNGGETADRPWTPQNGVRHNGVPIATIRDFIRFAGLPG